MSEPSQVNESQETTGPPAVDPVVHSHREEGTTPASRTCSNDDIRVNPSGTPTSDNASLRTRKRALKVGTWNVRSLYMKGKYHNVIQEMKELEVDMLGISEVRWKDVGVINTDGYKFFFSGGDEHANGVGMFMSEEIGRCTKGFWPISDRAMLIKIDATPFDISIIQGYAPTSEHGDDEVERFYADIQRGMKYVKSDEFLIVMGDFNAKVGASTKGDVVGKHGLGTRNDRGDRLIEFCEEQELIISNTWYKQPARRLYTWKSPGDVSRNQIDYILIRNRFRNAVQQVKTYPGADCNSDHNPVIAKIRVNLKNPKKPSPYRPMYEVGALRELQMKERYAIKVENKFQVLERTLQSEGQEEAETVQRQWTNFKLCIKEAAQETLPKKQKVAKQSWMTEDILQLMKERKRYKNRDNIKYKEIDADVRRKCIKAKEKWMEAQCEEIEELNRRHNSKGLHRKVKEVVGNHKKSCAGGTIKDKNGNVLFELDRIVARWAEYIEELFQDERSNDKPTIEKLDGPPILQSEVEHGLKRLSKGKAAGPDDITADLLQATGEKALQKLTELCNAIYNTGIIPTDLKRSVFIAIPKKTKAVECKDHRTISLMSHVTKLLLKIIHQRIARKIDSEISEEQYGFRSGRGTREAIFNLRILCERAIEVQQNIYLAFIDYEKAFDKVRHDQLMEILKNVDLDGKDLRIIRNLYWEQEAAMRVNGRESEWRRVKRGVRQGCVLSPCLFGLYSEIILRRTEDYPGIIVGGQNINNIRYADDTVLIASTEQDLQALVDVVNRKSEEMGLRINVKKTKCMIVSKNKTKRNITITVNGEKIEQVDEFVYLGALITTDGRCEAELRRRIAIAKATFHQMSKVFCNRNINLKLRYRMIKSYVWSTFTYGMETWTIGKAAQNKIEALEMWILRKMLRINYTQHKTNEKVLEEAGVKRELLTKIKQSKLQYFGHVMRHNTLQKQVLTGKIKGKRARGRQRMKWTDNIKKWSRLRRNENIHHAARERARWKLVAVNPRREDDTDR